MENNYAQHLEDSNGLATLWKVYGIRTIFFKGLALSRYYPNPSHREFGDLLFYSKQKREEGTRA
ncbi:MAG: nucleotidyltransferase family protein [Bacteroides thetaiotaomicron]|uniref:nucleotidyltransferase family protein n=1 Tax=Bacteroides thetaiotaomicron TaxID=818 RepID=UPI000CDEEDC6|nr:nucleotidyltransferase family protein [Bacteroides thetaiotaomicron]